MALCDILWIWFADGEYLLGRKYRIRFTFGKYHCISLVRNRHRNMFIARLEVKVKITQLCPIFETPMDCPWNSVSWNIGVGSLSLLQGIFPIQGLNPGLLHCRQILYQLSHQVVKEAARNKTNRASRIYKHLSHSWETGEAIGIGCPGSYLC